MSSTNCGMPDSWFHSLSFAYIYKGLLQEHCRKIGWPDPVYEHMKEGPDHIPKFTAKVFINKVVYTSPSGSLSRGDAELDAAKGALLGLYSVDSKTLNLTQLVHDAGLCKSMLQEYAQRMGYPIPTYICRMHEVDGMRPMFVSVVACGGTTYEGPAAKTKKAAEKNAAMYACAQIMAALSASIRENGVQ